ncbi:MAG: DUF3488 domain-containing protein, partial [Actinomycetota bacterium]|nr:DUF3488 domain-containing protein [Actinomycetota bacterium]
MSTRDRLTVAAALAVALACAALAPMYAGYGWVPATLTAVAVVAGAGALARRAGVTGVLVPLVQLLALGETALLMFARDTLAWLVVPTGRTVTALQVLAGQATTDVQGLAAPVPTRPALVLLAVLGAGAVAVLVDLAAVGLQRAALAGLPLLVLLAVPSGVLPGGLGWLPFTLGAAGWLGLLLVEGTDRISRWGLPLRSPRTGGAVDGSSAGRVGRRI